MAKVRRIRTRPASPSEVISTTVNLLTPQEGQEIKSTIIKYQNLKRGSKLYDQVRDYLDNLVTYHTARYRLQQSGFALQMLLDETLVKTGEISKSKHWTFKLINKITITTRDKDGSNHETRINADIYCVDTPDKDFTTKLPAYLPREKADEMELGFLDLGDINNPEKKEQDGTEGGTDDGSDYLEISFSDDKQAYVDEWRTRSPVQQVAIYRNNVGGDNEHRDFFAMLTKEEQTSLYEQLTEREKVEVRGILETPKTSKLKSLIP